MVGRSAAPPLLSFFPPLLLLFSLLNSYSCDRVSGDTACILEQWGYLSDVIFKIKSLCLNSCFGSPSPGLAPGYSFKIIVFVSPYFNV